MTNVIDSTVSAARTALTAADVRRALWRTYLPALKRYASPAEGILARSLVRESDGWTVTEPDALNTAEVVKALFLLEARGIAVPLDPVALLDRVVVRDIPSANQQVTALTLWAAALGRSGHADALWQTLRARVAPDLTQGLGLAWALAAACQYAAVARDRAEVAAFA